jgi:hypothetical protein
MPGIRRDLELGAPELARLGITRLNAVHDALLGTCAVMDPLASARLSRISQQASCSWGPWPSPGRQQTCGKTLYRFKIRRATLTCGFMEQFTRPGSTR